MRPEIAVALKTELMAWCVRLKKVSISIDTDRTHQLSASLIKSNFLLHRILLCLTLISIQHIIRQSIIISLIMLLEYVICYHDKAQPYC